MKSIDGGEIILYKDTDGANVLQLRASGGTIWLTQHELADLYGTSLPNVAQIIKRILDDNEVTEATINSELRVRLEGLRHVQREVKIYNLDMILAVGYRMSTSRAIQFRQWASTVLKEYLVKGFAMNDQYLKDPSGDDYFTELIERIRSIRASEKRFYQKIRDLFKDTSVDYDSTSGVAKTFFATIQNKLLFAVTGSTAAELVLKRANAELPEMGLTSWKGEILKRPDAEVAKNYLDEGEIKDLDRLTVMFLDFVEDRAERRLETSMSDWASATERFLSFNDRPLLQGSGKVSNSTMKKIVAERYLQFDQERRTAESQKSVEEEGRDLKGLLDSAEALTKKPAPPTDHS